MTETAYSAVLSSPLPGGRRLGVVSTGLGLSAIRILDPFQPLCAPTDPVSVAAAHWLDAYWRRPQRVPKLPALAWAGSAHQQLVWQALTAIPCGSTRSYGELAASMGSAAQAVAAACRRNPITLLVPCHRVVSAQGIGGYMGHEDGPAVAIKRWLLEHEGAL